MLQKILAVGGLCAGLMAPAVAQSQDELAQLARQLATSYAKATLPAFVEFYYQRDPNGGDQSPALRYDWRSDREWVDRYGATGTDFSGSGSSFFAKGNYVLRDQAVNPAELSELGGQWSWRWFPIQVANPLTREQGQAVQTCVQGAGDFDTTAEDCRRQLGFGGTRMQYWYADLSAQFKLEGDQDFDQRHYVYGLHANLSKSFGQQTWFIHPVLGLALEQVDPVGDAARAAVLADDELYPRVSAKFGFTSKLFELKGQPIKLSFSARYFQELNAEDAIRDADLDRFHYTAVAIQVPAVLVPGFDNTHNSFVLSYGAGRLPFNLRSEKTVALGFRHDVDFAEFF